VRQRHIARARRAVEQRRRAGRSPPFEAHGVRGVAQSRWRCAGWRLPLHPGGAAAA
jgi:hypothetical protein